MGTTLQSLKPNDGATRKRKRVGRGLGSGRGKTSTKGVKGQKARTGHHGARFGFEGGQMPLQRRLPKRGFKNFFRVDYFGLNVGAIEERCDAGTYDLDGLKAAGLVPRKAIRVKVLGAGDVTKKFVIKATAFSEAAKEKLEKAGGGVEVVAA
jgi:large subunit ribosomal protein L15